jgi:precorrin-6B C5,15-methyltransferase / cobalt-precorrin-6B C5,C15-methyltransferase
MPLPNPNASIETSPALTAMPEPWLSIVGIGEDGLAGLSPASRSLIAAAELVAGGARHLQLVGALARRTLAWPSPMDKGLANVVGMRGRPVVVLATGDPFFHGVGALLARTIPPGEFMSFPQPSAFSLAANRLGWALQDVITIGINGRAIERLIPQLQLGARILALSADQNTPLAVARLLSGRGLGPSRLTVLEAMGGPRERVRTATAADFGLAAINPLNTVAIEVQSDGTARILPRSPGLPDDWFEHDGQITKREARALTLASLAPRRGEHLWDLGCGSGSVAIEWMLADPSCRATAVEIRPDRVARAARNALGLGVPGLRIEIARAADVVDRLEPPDAIFIGGGAREPELVDRVWEKLPTGGRLVINAVTLETEAVVLSEYGRRGGRLVRLSIERAESMGGLTGWRPALPVTHWAVEKS